MSEVLEQYRITEGGFNQAVSIIGGRGKTKQYKISKHALASGTAALLDQIKQEMIGSIRISAEEILDPRIINQLRVRFMDQAREMVKTKLPNVGKEVEQYLVMTLVKDMLGLGDLEILLNDPHLEEVVVISATEPVRVFHKKYGWLLTNVLLPTEADTKNYFNTIARRVGRQITTLNPLLDAHLVSGDRANAVLYPIASKGNTLTIRKFARDPWTVTDFIANSTCTPDVFDQIWFAMQYESNVLVSGGTGSGKTSFLNVCMPFIPPNHRIISIEDTRELMLPEFLYWCPMTTRKANPEGKGEVTMLDLLVNSLRMRPDRIILGEMRKKDQAEVLFEAMHTGHSVYATVHADSLISTLHRLTNPPIEIPSNLLGAVNLTVVMFRNRRQNVRRMYQIGEFLPVEEGGQMSIKPNLTHRWNPATDSIIAHQKPVRFFDELSRHTGLSQGEIRRDIASKENILKWLVKHKVRDISSVGRIMHDYYLDPEQLVQSINKNTDPKTLLIRSSR